jgi:dihydrolipoamide dehydrogenase
MNERRIFDIVIIGAGPAGYCAAIRAAQLGLSTVVVEKNAALGGTCLNVGCIPSKALLDSSERFAMAKSSLASHGIKVENVSFDLGLMMERKNKVVAKLTDNIEMLFRENRIHVIRGAAKFTGSRLIEAVSSDGLSTVEAARAVIIATGSAPIALPALPFDTKVVDSTGALALDRVPGRLAIVGGGAIGVELASVWARLGSQVTIIEHMPQLLPGWDGQSARLLGRLLTKQGITIIADASITDSQTHDDSIRLTVQYQGKDLTIVADRVLVAVGRRPYLDGLQLDKISVAADPKTGRIPVSDRFMTSCEGVYAIGDCIAGPMLAHKAFEEGVAVAELIAGKAGFVNYRTIPAVVYSSPEIASVGATEEGLQKRGISFTSGTYSLKANGRALAMDMTDGFVKVIAHGATDAILGVHIVGHCASELVAEAVSVMEFGGSSEDLGRTIHAHPTLSEAVKEAALDNEKRAIHIPPVRKKENL